MIDSSCDRDPVELLADEFAARSRQGQSPSISEYVAKYPLYAEQIRQLFPAVAMMEQLRAEEDSQRNSAGRCTKSFDVPERIGDFDIIRQIGRGGMGVVYEAEQRSLARRVAVKVLPEQVLLGSHRLDRFRREAQIAARLRHTAIVPVFGVGEQGGLHYYVMPLVRGVGLDEIIAALRAERTASDNGQAPSNHAPAELCDFRALVRALIEEKFPLPQSAVRDSHAWEPRHRTAPSRWATVARLGLQAAEALEYAHVQGTLHRDVKPGNLLVDEQGNACLADFGLARAIEPGRPGHDGDRLRAREVVGTPRYMAPEQLQGIADARTDVYGLGLTLYELLTCTRPDRHIAVRPTPPREIDRTIPRDLEAIVLKCLAHEPARRYQNAAALCADLRRFLEDRPIRARRASRVERGLRFCGRNPALAAVSATAAVLVIAFVFVASFGHVRTRAAYRETQAALARVEATSGVALEVLEGLYLQLSPERVWIPSDSDPAGQACACLGLRSARPAAPDQPDYIQVQPSEQTAALLQNLLVFYDRLAEQVSDDARVALESAIATRRVGDIRQRLGQLDQAEREYRKAIARLEILSRTAAASEQIGTELARCHNEIGNVRFGRFEPHAAYDAHREALRSLQTAASPQPASEEFRFELARTYFLLAGRHPGHYSISARDRREDSSPERPAQSEREYRARAIGLLEGLAGENPDAADYRFLLALCYRSLGIVPAHAHGTLSSASGEENASMPATVSGRQRALEILESLKSQYPQVADYRYELAATYAWVHVGLFPWQERSVVLPRTERALRKALDEARWLVDNNPTIPHFARSKALILAKLGAVCAEAGRMREAADWFDQAVGAQSALVERYPDIPAHDRVLREFFRYRLATLCQGSGESADWDASGRAGSLLETCVETLTELRSRRDLADDRLAAISLQLAEDALGQIRSR
ncbi:MAG: protein kinase [Thermoguttaceae bacterium]|jgi:serine/threonine protein kinase|nr:protein kinase [Thermoguttaceae bacterium]